MGQKIKVGLIYGGKSGEHEVSLQTAFAVIQSFDFKKYEIIPFYITRQGEWRKGLPLTGPVSDIADLTLEHEKNQPSSMALKTLFQFVDRNKEPKELDVVFPLLHGTFGEDGTIQGLLEMANIPYVGAGVLASAVGMDKVMMKKVFTEAGLPQCNYRYFTSKQWERDSSFFIMEVEIHLGYPCFVKPANLGSSVGISKANHRDELIEAITYAFRFDRKVIVEEYVDAREIEISVLGNDDPITSVPGEIISANEFYDYQAKYSDGKTRLIIPAENLSEKQIERLQELAVKAFQAIDGSGLSRVDFFVRRGDGEVFINEINTMPGFTPFSMYPMMWQKSGKSYSELLDHLIELALERYNEKQRIQYEFEAANIMPK